VSRAEMPLGSGAGIQHERDPRGNPAVISQGRRGGGGYRDFSTRPQLGGTSPSADLTRLPTG
jgi:hypothetical protein